MLERVQVDINSASVVELKRVINDWLYHYTDGTVQSGPFKGMKILPDRCWDDGNIGTELLGCYEQELHGIVEEEIKRLAGLPSPKIVDLGCAEGYYAIGMARRLPDAEVWVHDISEKALEATALAAQANGVLEQVMTGSVDVMLENCDLVICDCEGGEIEYLDMDRHPALASTIILVECHNFGQSVTSILGERFRDTHAIYYVPEGPRDPNQFEFLRGWHSHARWMAVSEGRPCHMNYLLMRPKDEAAA